MNNSILMGVVIGLLAIMTGPIVMTTANASPQGNNSNVGQFEPGQAYVIFDEAVKHINNAQAALQNGDTEGANNHLELAKQSLQSNQSNQGQE